MHYCLAGGKLNKKKKFRIKNFFYILNYEKVCRLRKNKKFKKIIFLSLVKFHFSEPYQLKFALNIVNFGRNASSFRQIFFNDLNKTLLMFLHFSFNSKPT